jgi:hypothetical protein
MSTRAAKRLELTVAVPCRRCGAPRSRIEIQRLAWRSAKRRQRRLRSSA